LQDEHDIDWFCLPAAFNPAASDHSSLAGEAVGDAINDDVSQSVLQVGIAPGHAYNCMPLVACRTASSLKLQNLGMLGGVLAAWQACTVRVLWQVQPSMHAACWNRLPQT
jgi:hypothetical protein